MIICKECLEKFKLNILKREVKCPHCDTTIDFGKLKRVNMARLLLKTLYLVIYFVIVFFAVSLSIWFPWAQRLLIGLLLLGIIAAVEMLLFLPMARRIIVRMYNNHDKEA